MTEDRTKPNAIILILVSPFIFAIFVASIVVIMPWLKDWIVYVWQSPLTAGEASREYLWQTIEAVSPFILLAVFVTAVKEAIAEIRREREGITNETVINILEAMPPTPSSEAPISAPTSPKIEAVNEESREEETEIIWESKGENGAIAHHVKRYSPEWKQLIAKQKESITEISEEDRENLNRKLNAIFRK